LTLEDYKAIAAGAAIVTAVSMVTVGSVVYVARRILGAIETLPHVSATATEGLATAKIAMAHATAVPEIGRRADDALRTARAAHERLDDHSDRLTRLESDANGFKDLMNLHVVGIRSDIKRLTDEVATFDVKLAAAVQERRAPTSKGD
jgi:hypothetical protein